MPDLSGREWAAILPLLALMVWMGVAAQSFLPSIGASNAQTLRLSGTGVETRVNAPVPFPIAGQEARNAK